MEYIQKNCIQVPPGQTLYTQSATVQYRKGLISCLLMPVSREICAYTIFCDKILCIQNVVHTNNCAYNNCLHAQIVVYKIKKN